ncbi:SDR family NAD(P)-dependent oxidoreductase [Streptomyces sp. WM6386]|uniref:SDR family NAD(P)-dependent oxidoreductase n=1 Tax=Streptomyces sp. WM6386 TaxID=1415558 RepID=UPI000619391A|nr:SDR family NAD(P)-dependent oxidoreductase [Streptomyces sp. WM6386]KKD06653.1 dehydrogenase [Streptomyces sp. WM6386]
MNGRLEGRVALITGTGGGMGRAAALRFAEEGAVIVGCDLNLEANEETAAAVKAADGRMSAAAPVDLGDSAAARTWVEQAAEEHGGIDIVYNNASAARFGPVGTLPEEDWHFTVRNEVDLVFYVTQSAWPYLTQRGGVVINIASLAGHTASRAVPMLAHAATKGAILAMTRQLAAEGAPHGIRAVSISPGVIETPGTAGQFADPVVLDALRAQLLVPRPGLPKDVVGLAAFLASDEASYITGTDFVVDGGMSAI